MRKELRIRKPGRRPKRKQYNIPHVVKKLTTNPELLVEALDGDEDGGVAALLASLERDTKLLFRFLKKFPQLGYVMNRAQRRAHMAYERAIACFWPNRVGKTVFLVNRAHAASQGERKWLPKYDPRRKFTWKFEDPDSGEVEEYQMTVPNVGRLYVNDYKAFERDVQQEWESWVPQGTYKYTKNTQGNVTKITMDNKSVIHIMTYEQSPTAAEGGRLNWACFNEPCPKTHFTATLRGLMDTNGPWWMAMTLIDEEPWIFDELYEAGHHDPNIAIIEASIEDNCRENGGVLTRKFIAEFSKHLDEDERTARLEGRPKFAAGKVFKGFHKKEPWIVEKALLLDHWPRFGAIDPHDRKPDAVMWAAVDPGSSTVFIYDELYDSDLHTVSEVCHEVNGRDKTRPKPTMWWIDPAATKPDPISGSNVQFEYQRHGIIADTWSRADKTSRIIRGRDWFKVREKTNLPKVVIFERCSRTIWELGRYMYSPKTGKPTKDDDDLVDCFLALCNVDIISLASTWIPKEPTKTYSLGMKLSSWAKPMAQPRSVTGY